MTTDFRALCARMADRLDHYQQLLTDDRTELDPLATEARKAFAESDEPAVSDDREPASVSTECTRTNLALRVQRLEQQRETEKAALLDAFRQIDELKQRIDFHYFKLHRIEDSLPITAQTIDD